MVAPTFEFATAGRIVFGVGCARKLAEIVASLGTRALLVTGARPQRFGALLGSLQTAGNVVDSVAIGGEPTLTQIEQAVERARSLACDVVVGLGGGSPIDAAKAIAALVPNRQPSRTYLEVIGLARPLEHPALPVVAVPTTAGTGSEVTRNAVIKAELEQVKVSLRHASMLPRVALVDPELTVSLPREVTADCGLDALTQVIEPFVSRLANPMTDGFCREGIVRAARSLVRACSHGDDLQARSDMALASLFGGLALANAKLGAVHGFAGPLGGMFEAPHGAICARLLPGVMEANADAIRRVGGSAQQELLGRFTEVARLVTGRADATIEDGTAWIREVCAALGVRGLGAYGLTSDVVPTVVEKAAASSSMQGNPVALPQEVLAQILTAAL